MVSVIIPCFNIEEYVSVCLDCFLSQTYREIEIICVDDGSTDNTPKIIESYMVKDARVRLIRQSNQYAGVARNNGFNQASGEYVLFFDGDDYCEKDMIASMVESANRYNSDIVVCDVRTYDNQTGRYDYSVSYLKNSLVKEYENIGVVSFRDIPDNILLLASSGPWNKLYRKDFIEKEKLRFQASKRDNDEYFVLMSMALAERISWVPKKFVTYRVNNPSSLQGFGEKVIDTNDLISTIRELKDGLKRKNRYELLKKSFKNQVLVRYVGLIEGQRSWENFKKIFDFTKTCVFPEFEIDNMNIQDIFVRTEERIRIIEGTAEEYVFWRMKKMESGRGERYIFPYEELEGCRKIAIYGAGTVGKAYYRQICDNEMLCLIGWYDLCPESCSEDNYSIKSPDLMVPEVIQKIVIAIESKYTAMKVRDFLITRGFEDKNIIWKI